MKLLTMVISDKSYSKFEKKKTCDTEWRNPLSTFSDQRAFFFLREKLWDQGSESQNRRNHHWELITPKVNMTRRKWARNSK